jgi:hypothetical protein
MTGMTALPIQASPAPATGQVAPTSSRNDREAGRRQWPPAIITLQTTLLLPLFLFLFHLLVRLLFFHGLGRLFFGGFFGILTFTHGFTPVDMGE